MEDIITPEQRVQQLEQEILLLKRAHAAELKKMRAEIEGDNRWISSPVLGSPASSRSLDPPRNVNDNHLLWQEIAEAMVNYRSTNYNSNLLLTSQTFQDRAYAKFLAPALVKCPHIIVILASILTNNVYVARREKKNRVGNFANDLKR